MAVRRPSPRASPSICSASCFSALKVLAVSSRKLRLCGNETPSCRLIDDMVPRGSLVVPGNALYFTCLPASSPALSPSPGSDCHRVLGPQAAARPASLTWILSLRAPRGGEGHSPFSAFEKHSFPPGTTEPCSGVERSRAPPSQVCNKRGSSCRQGGPGPAIVLLEVRGRPSGSVPHRHHGGGVLRAQGSAFHLRPPRPPGLCGVAGISACGQDVTCGGL